MTGEEELLEHLRVFSAFGASGMESSMAADDGSVIPVFTNEYWTARQRQANPLHEISYRACFKPQLPRFFIQRLTRADDTVYDPFMGRGTTLLEAALLNRVPAGCDISPLSRVLLEPRLCPPLLQEVARRLTEIDFNAVTEIRRDLQVFYHPDTLRSLCALRDYMLQRQAKGLLDASDRWIRMVATNRLSGHSSGFFSVYTLPPNQATSIASQEKINQSRGQTPPLRDVPRIILKKSRLLLTALSDIDRLKLHQQSESAKLLTASADNTPGLADASVDLVVTSPPFLNVVQYATDNWLRCWFNGIDAKSVKIWMLSNAEAWSKAMEDVFRELWRVLKPGGWVAFEVGEVRKKSINLENLVVPAGRRAGLKPVAVMINSQNFTKTANCWGVANNKGGTNTNRIILLRKVN